MVASCGKSKSPAAAQRRALLMTNQENILLGRHCLLDTGLAYRRSISIPGTLNSIAGPRSRLSSRLSSRRSSNLSSRLSSSRPPRPSVSTHRCSHKGPTHKAGNDNHSRQECRKGCSRYRRADSPGSHRKYFGYNDNRPANRCDWHDVGRHRLEAAHRYSLRFQNFEKIMPSRV